MTTSKDNKAGGDQKNINTGGGDYAGRDIDKRQGEIFVDGNVYGDIVREQHIYYQPATTLGDRQQQRNRYAMLQKVKTIWIDGLLEQSLAKELRLALNLTAQPDAVSLPLNTLVQELNQPARPLPAGTPIIDVFTQMSGALLILGAPGAGKTTLLLELARDLIARAEQGEEHPIPVVFNLSSWAAKRQPLKEWLVEELNTKYDVPHKLAQTWMDADVVLPLLDGLDEVAVKHRGACVEVINRYRQEEHGLVPLAICSRVADYEALTTKVRLQGAIVVELLTQPQIEGYFERIGDELAGVQVALRHDAELAELLTTPLMLSITALAYTGRSAVDVQLGGTIDERRRHLFDAYIEAMFKRRSEETRYTQEQTVKSLRWLAGQIVQLNQTVFYIEWMQPAWLPRQQRTKYAIFVRLVFGLIAGLLGALAFGLAFGLVGALVGGLVGVLVGGLIGALGGGPGAGLRGGLAGALADRSGNIKVIETLRWSWSRDVLFAGLFGGLFAGLLGGLLFGLGFGLGGGLGGGLLFGLGFGLGGNEINIRMMPNQGIYRSARSMVAVGLGVGLGIGLLFGLIGGPLFGLLFGVVWGLFFGLDYGGRAVFQHYTLRWLLSRNGGLPFRDKNLIPFLDYCVERIFLRKVGGGYIFIHRLLMEHFASLYDQANKVTK